MRASGITELDGRNRITKLDGGTALPDLIAVEMAGLTGLHGAFKAKCCKNHEEILNFTTFYSDEPYYGTFKMKML